MSEKKQTTIIINLNYLLALIAFWFVLHTACLMHQNYLKYQLDTEKLVLDYKENRIFLSKLTPYLHSSKMLRK